MKTYSFSDAAVRDINDICEFYGQENVDVASRLFDNIRMDEFWRKEQKLNYFDQLGSFWDIDWQEVRGYL